MFKILQQIVKDKRRQGLSRVLILNYLREYLQYLVLNLIYNNSLFNQKLSFKGGSCLRVVYQLPRLSEDLDFDLAARDSSKIINRLSDFLVQQLSKRYLLPVEAKTQSTLRLYLKFAVLTNLGLTPQGESNKLYVKVEISSKMIAKAKFELTPISRFGLNFVIYHYDLPTLMVGKINAFLYRTWFKGKNNKIDIKGRDFYDLYWFFNKGVEPNWSALEKTTRIKNKTELREEILKRIEKTDSSQVAYDLKNFIDDSVFVSQFAKNYKKILLPFLR